MEDKCIISKVKWNRVFLINFSLTKIRPFEYCNCSLVYTCFCYSNIQYSDSHCLVNSSSSIFSLLVHLQWLKKKFKFKFQIFFPCRMNCVSIYQNLIRGSCQISHRREIYLYIKNFCNRRQFDKFSPTAIKFHCHLSIKYQDLSVLSNRPAYHSSLSNKITLLSLWFLCLICHFNFYIFTLRLHIIWCATNRPS